jgi:sugar phosphate isomerase/epimerase
MPREAAPVIAVSSWSVHRALGIFHPNSPADDAFGEAQEKWGKPQLGIMDLPEAISRRGIGHLQLCHFHLESRDPAYLGEVRAAIADARVTLSTLLIDDGDITHPTEHDRDRDWIGKWIDAAAELGAKAARVIAGKQQPTPETLGRSVEGLRALARRGAEQGVRVTTENWLALTASPKEVHHILERLDGEVGFMADFGNWKTTGKARYDDLASIFARSEDTHAKAWFPTDGAIDAEDFGQCLAAARRTGYSGPYTLIYEDKGADEWTAVEIERDFVKNYFNGGHA